MPNLETSQTPARARCDLNGGAMAQTARESSVVVVLPAYDTKGLAEFLEEIDGHLASSVRNLHFIVVDDHAEAPASHSVSALAPVLQPRVSVVRHERRLGHAASVMRAYREALALKPDIVIHVDGDGQFLGRDVRRVLNALEGRDGAIGVRVGRRDPWLSRRLTGGERSSADDDSPLRAYRREPLERLVARVPDGSIVPHLQFARLHRTLRLRTTSVDVTRARRPAGRRRLRGARRPAGGPRTRGGSGSPGASGAS